MLYMQGSFNNYKAVVFDFDGTITKKGVHYPSPEMVEVLAKVSEKVPIACCTGRQLESFLRHGLEFFEGVNLANLYLMAENGAVGYFYDTEFKEFYRSPWPEEFTARDSLMQRMNEVIKEFGSVYFEAHRIVIVLRTHLHDLPAEERDPDEVATLSEKIYYLACAELALIDRHYERFLHVGDSGIGVVIGPANGDKDFGLQMFGKFLAEERGMSFSPDLKEIMAIGDRPQVGGNDHYLLNGRFGTPFSVGVFGKGVFNENGERLFHEEATRRLLLDYFGV